MFHVSIIREMSIFLIIITRIAVTDAAVAAALHTAL